MVRKTTPNQWGGFFQLFLGCGQEQHFEYLITLENKNSKTFFKKPLDKIPLLCYNVNVIKGQDPKRNEMKVMNNYLCEDLENGGYFFVQCDSIEEAEEILLENGFNLDDVDFLDVMDDETAEIYGYDTY